MENKTVTVMEYYLPEGTILDGRYRIIRVLGCGGFGITYEAINENTNGRVAIKEFYNRNYMGRINKDIVLTDGEMQVPFQKAKERFLREARRLRDYSSEPGVVHIRNYFEQNNTAYIVMEYIGGISLQEYFDRKGRIEAGRLFQLLYPLMVTLEKIHKSGVVHRDISPDNIKFTDDPDGAAGIKLIDFGSARDYMDDRTYTIELKEGYAPPEQYSGHEQGPWTDIYALCAVLYCGITGQKPIRSSIRKMKDELLMPSQMGIAIDPKLEKILKKGLNIEREKRYQNLEELLTELKPILYPKKKNTGGNKKGKIFLAASIAACVLAAGGYGGWRYYQDHLAYFKFHGEKTETVLLTPYDDMSTKDYKKNVKIIKKRLDYLWGEEGYILREKEDGLEITTTLENYKAENIDKDVFETIRMYVAEPLRLNFTAISGDDNEARFSTLERDEIVSVKKKEGEIPVEDRTPEDIYSGDGLDAYIEVKITDEAAERIRKDLQDIAEEDNSYTMLVTDSGTEYRSKRLLCTDMNGDWTTFYCKVRKESSAWKALWKTEELSDPFQISYEIQADWEEESGIWGKYQCQEKDIQQPSVTMDYRITSIMYWDNEGMDSAGAWSELLYDVKTRIDALKIPYAVGIAPDDTGRILIKTAQKDMNPFLAEMLTGLVSVALESEDISQKMDIYSSIGSLKLQEEEDGSYSICLKLSLTDSIREEMETLRKTVQQSENHRLYLTVEGYRIAWTELKSEEIPETLVFRNNCYGNSAIFTKSDVPLLQMIITAMEQSSLAGYESYGYARSQYSSKDSVVNEEAEVENEEYMPMSKELENIKKGIHKFNKNAEVTENRGSKNRLDITLRYDLNKSYATKVISDIEQLLETEKDNLKIYDDIVIYPGYKNRGSGVQFRRSGGISGTAIENWKMLYYRAGKDNEEEGKMAELLEKSESLKEYRTEDSFVENQNWWWFYSDLW